MTNTRKLILGEWERRAEREGDLAVMSTRYPPSHCETESRRYADAVVNFIGVDIDRKSVLEIGAGTGRLTERLVRQADALTCVEISAKMIARNRKRLGKDAERVRYLHGFAQDLCRGRFDVIVSSLVLIHNTENESFLALVNTLQQCSDVIFVFEHVERKAIERHSFTRIRTEAELCEPFSAYRIAKRSEHFLFDDRILFFKFERHGVPSEMVLPEKGRLSSRQPIDDPRLSPLV